MTSITPEILRNNIYNCIALNRCSFLLKISHIWCARDTSRKENNAPQRQHRDVRGRRLCQAYSGDKTPWMLLHHSLEMPCSVAKPCKNVLFACKIHGESPVFVEILLWTTRRVNCVLQFKLLMFGELLSRGGGGRGFAKSICYQCRRRGPAKIASVWFSLVNVT